MIKNKVTVIGLGYVGLPLACAIAQKGGYRVFGLDLDEKKIALIKQKKSPIDDPDTAKLLKTVNLTVSTNIETVKDSEYVIVCVPTPVRDNKLPDLGPVKGATQTILKYLEKGQYIIIESTINPGICEEIVLPILEKSGLKGGKDFELSHCPERINPGDPKWNVINIPRNIGSITEKGNKKVANFYRSFLQGKINEVSSLKIAEATKIIENTFRDINIAYVNELAKSFDIMGIDLLETIKAASNKPFAFMPHFPGCGVGGHCIPVDPYYLINRAQKAGFNHSFLKKARQVNNSMPEYAVDLLEQKLKIIGKKITNTKIGLLGISYKANISDLRESPSLEIIKILKKKKASFTQFDPYVPILSDVKSLEELLQKSEALIVATNHDIFKKIPVSLFKKYNIKVVIDGKNCLDKSALEKNGIIHKGIGH